MRLNVMRAAFLSSTTAREFMKCTQPRQMPCASHVPHMCLTCASHVPHMCLYVFVYFRQHAQSGWQRDTYLNTELFSGLRMLAKIYKNIEAHVRHM